MKLFTPLQPVSTPAERRRRRNLYRILAVQGVLALLMVYFAAVRQNLLVVFVLIGVLFLGNLVLVATASQISSTSWLARKRLREAGYRVCPTCSYDLSASALQGVCPECGDPYSPETLREKWEEAYQKILQKPGN